MEESRVGGGVLVSLLNLIISCRIQGTEKQMVALLVREKKNDRYMPF